MTGLMIRFWVVWLFVSSLWVPGLGFLLFKFPIPVYTSLTEARAKGESPSDFLKVNGRLRIQEEKVKDQMG